MMKQEFEERVGLKVTDKEYAQIKREYMANNKHRDVFCKEWLRKITGAEYKAMAERVIKMELPPLTKGTLTNKRYMETVIELVKETPEFKQIEPMIDYMLADDFDVWEITNYEFNFVAAINYPCNEGIYIDCWLQGDFDNSGRQKIGMGTIKTLADNKAAMMLMGELTGLLIWVAGEYLQQQINRGYFKQ